MTNCIFISSFERRTTALAQIETDTPQRSRRVFGEEGILELAGVEKRWREEYEWIAGNSF